MVRVDLCEFLPLPKFRGCFSFKVFRKSSKQKKHRKRKFQQFCCEAIHFFKIPKSWCLPLPKRDIFRQKSFDSFLVGRGIKSKIRDHQFLIIPMRSEYHSYMWTRVFFCWYHFGMRWNRVKSTSRSQRFSQTQVGGLTFRRNRGPS